VRELHASLAAQGALYASAYAALAAELKRAQVEEAVLVNVVKVQTVSTLHMSQVIPSLGLLS